MPLLENHLFQPTKNSKNAKGCKYKLLIYGT